MEKYLQLSCSLYGGISALFLFTPKEKYLLSSCLLYGGSSALFLLNSWRNTFSLPACCMEKYLLSSCSLHEESLSHPAAWRNLCSQNPAHCIERKTFSHSAQFTEVLLLSPCTQYGEIHALTLLTFWRNSALTLSPCSLYGGIPALTLLAVWRNP
jgi:hypothetical protein